MGRSCVVVNGKKYEVTEHTVNAQRTNLNGFAPVKAVIPVATEKPA